MKFERLMVVHEQGSGRFADLMLENFAGAHQERLQLGVRLQRSRAR